MDEYFIRVFSILTINTPMLKQNHRKIVYHYHLLYLCWMKKIKIIVALSCILFLQNNFCKSQFIQGYGITGGLTWCTERWNYHAVSQTETKDFHLGMNASAFLEMGDYYNIRWISEIQYNRKGAKDEFPYYVVKNNEITYLSWNNFAKFRRELENTTPYIIAGGRLEYKFSTINGGFTDSPSVSIASFALLHVCVSAGAGMEFFIHSTISPFIEAQYFTDIPMIPYAEAYVNKGDQDLHIRNHGIELRIGFKFYFIGNDKDKCPPVYVTPGAAQ
jgi:hypothetical protein